MAIGVSLGLFIVLMAAISVYGYHLYARPARFHERLGNAVGGQETTSVLETGIGPQPKAVVRLAHWIGEKAPVSAQDTSIARKLLVAAGYRSPHTVKVYYGLKIALGVIGFIAAMIGRAYINNPILSIVVIPAGAGGGFMLPNLLLDHMIGKRQERLRLSLPDALDLLVVCMEAGLGLDQAIVNVSRELQSTHKDISDELSLVSLEMRAGSRRTEALKSLADRTGETELRKLVATMIQADRFGTGVGESLRTHSEFLRVRRRQEAEERAGKVGVKLVFPIFFFILPAMLLVAAGPGLLQLFKNLFPMMRGFH